jgi:hypothetical protein
VASKDTNTEAEEAILLEAVVTHPVKTQQTENTWKTVEGVNQQ